VGAVHRGERREPPPQGNVPGGPEARGCLAVGCRRFHLERAQRGGGLPLRPQDAPRRGRLREGGSVVCGEGRRRQDPPPHLPHSLRGARGTVGTLVGGGVRGVGMGRRSPPPPPRQLLLRRRNSNRGGSGSRRRRRRGGGGGGGVSPRHGEGEFDVRGTVPPTGGGVPHSPH
ncbi:unnamed protein product, partial [Ectocarpus sp. 12 AP-2014]